MADLTWLLCIFVGHRWEKHHDVTGSGHPGAVWWCPRCGEAELR